MTTIITKDDVDYLQNQPDISLILSGMMSLLQDSDNKVEELQKQNWFQRMWKTVTGKNKATANEVQQNHEKLSAYMTQAMQILYERNVMTQQMVNNLGLQLNVLYQEYNHLKEMLGAFVEKLNEKIISIDNFHMLSEEIRLKMYANDKPIIAICKVVTQLDERTVNDPRKMQILQQSLVQEGILSENPIPLQELFMDLLTCTPEEAGQFILGFGAIRQHYLPSLFLEFLETYYYMSDMERKLKSKEKFCTHYLDLKQIETNFTLSSEEVFDCFVSSLDVTYVNLELSPNLAEISEQMTEFTNLHEKSKKTSKRQEDGFVIESGCLLAYTTFDERVECIPDSVTVIGREAFSIAKAGEHLKWITLPLSDYPKRDLTSITIPSSVEKIEREAFSDCKNLTTVIFEGNMSDIEIHSTAFERTPWGEQNPILKLSRMEEIDMADVLRQVNSQKSSSATSSLLRGFLGF